MESQFSILELNVIFPKSRIQLPKKMVYHKCMVAFPCMQHGKSKIRHKCILGFKYKDNDRSTIVLVIDMHGAQ